MGYRITVDMGGTFTDLTVSDDSGRLWIGKSPTTPERAFRGVWGALGVAASDMRIPVENLLKNTDLFVYGTTKATNAILEGKTARTAFLCTEGFPDILVMREGGKSKPFDLAVPYPDPYVPRHLTWEISERVDAEGGIVRELNEAQAREVLEKARKRGVEAVGVCLLWSTVNNRHEVRMGELIEEILPGLPYTLSHTINPTIREFRRASATVMDASLKPVMSAHLRAIEGDLLQAGFEGELMASTSLGGVLHFTDLSTRPIYSAKSGPSMAPRAGILYGRETGHSDIVVCDAGGTSFDVSLVRNGEIALSRTTWIGPQYLGHMTGMSSVDVRSIGAGGGSIAWIDNGGLLHVGPESAGAEPGPACYGKGGEHPTVTDAAAVVGYLDPDHFLGGRMCLDVQAARSAVGELGMALGLSAEEGAIAILRVANEHMVGAIREITVNEGVDPRESLVVAGGGAGGMNIVPIVRELGCKQVLVPRTAGALTAAGAQYSDIVLEFASRAATRTDDFKFEEVGRVLSELDRQMDEAATRLSRRGYLEFTRSYSTEARYVGQVWDLDLEIPSRELATDEAVARLMQAFDDTHFRVFAVADRGQPVKFSTWKARLSAAVARELPIACCGSDPPRAPEPVSRRPGFFAGEGELETRVFLGGDLRPRHVIEGPAILVEPSTTVVVYPHSAARVTDANNYLLEV